MHYKVCSDKRTLKKESLLRLSESPGILNRLSAARTAEERERRETRWKKDEEWGGKDAEWQKMEAEKRGGSDEKRKWWWGFFQGWRRYSDPTLFRHSWIRTRAVLLLLLVNERITLFIDLLTPNWARLTWSSSFEILVHVGNLMHWKVMKWTRPRMLFILSILLWNDECLQPQGPPPSINQWNGA